MQTTIKSIAQRIADIRDSIGWNEDADIRDQVMDLCKELAILALQVDAVVAGQDGVQP